tara:strand:+ start:3905 stop:6922 length:3018 start_codon:yes stop_codon:yes gene_type:complete
MEEPKDSRLQRLNLHEEFIPLKDTDGRYSSSFKPEYGSNQSLFSFFSGRMTPSSDITANSDRQSMNSLTSLTKLLNMSSSKTSLTDLDKSAYSSKMPELREPRKPFGSIGSFSELDIPIEEEKTELESVYTPILPAKSHVSNKSSISPLSTPFDTPISQTRNLKIDTTENTTKEDLFNDFLFCFQKKLNPSRNQMMIISLNDYNSDKIENDKYIVNEYKHPNQSINFDDDTSADTIIALGYELIKNTHFTLRDTKIPRHTANFKRFKDSFYENPLQMNDDIINFKGQPMRNMLKYVKFHKDTYNNKYKSRSDEEVKRINDLYDLKIQFLEYIFEAENILKNAAYQNTIQNQAMVRMQREDNEQIIHKLLKERKDVSLKMKDLITQATNILIKAVKLNDTHLGMSKETLQKTLLEEEKNVNDDERYLAESVLDIILNDNMAKENVRNNIQSIFEKNINFSDDDSKDANITDLLPSTVIRDITTYAIGGSTKDSFSKNDLEEINIMAEILNDILSKKIKKTGGSREQAIQWIDKSLEFTFHISRKFLYNELFKIIIEPQLEEFIKDIDFTQDIEYTYNEFLIRLLFLLNQYYNYAITPGILIEITDKLINVNISKSLIPKIIFEELKPRPDIFITLATTNDLNTFKFLIKRLGIKNDDLPDMENLTIGGMDNLFKKNQYYEGRKREGEYARNNDENIFANPNPGETVTNLGELINIIINIICPKFNVTIEYVIGVLNSLKIIFPFLDTRTIVYLMVLLNREILDGVINWDNTEEKKQYLASLIKPRLNAYMTLVVILNNSNEPVDRQNATGFAVDMLSTITKQDDFVYLYNLRNSLIEEANTEDRELELHESYRPLTMHEEDRYGNALRELLSNIIREEYNNVEGNNFNEEPEAEHEDIIEEIEESDVKESEPVEGVIEEFGEPDAKETESVEGAIEEIGEPETKESESVEGAIKEIGEPDAKESERSEISTADIDIKLEDIKLEDSSINGGNSSLNLFYKTKVYEL